MYTVYCISSTSTNFAYINATEDYEACVNMHNKMLIMQKHPIKELQKVYNKKGPEDILYIPMEDRDDNHKDSVVLAYRAAMSAKN
jgi:hypothetical protein